MGPCSALRDVYEESLKARPKHTSSNRSSAGAAVADVDPYHFTKREIDTSAIDVLSRGEGRAETSHNLEFWRHITCKLGFMIFVVVSFAAWGIVFSKAPLHKDGSLILRHSPEEAKTNLKEYMSSAGIEPATYGMLVAFSEGPGFETPQGRTISEGHWVGGCIIGGERN